jgi:MoaA/NifB/PqqE/SkfB family radical SAM enzyme
MQPLICSRVVNKYLVASRYDKVGTIISKEQFEELRELSKGDSELPIWIEPLIKKIGLKTKTKVKNSIFIRDETRYRFGRVSYEITERCNYDCQHCYLDKKSLDTLNLSEKERIIQIIANSGCLWLQITGGEPLIDVDFPYVYNLAHSLGMLVTLSTNGSLLTKKKISGLLQKKPPYRLTVSMYGGSQKSYESLTQKKGSFGQFISGLDWARSANVRTRLNIIVTKYNSNEINEMIRIARHYGFEHHIFSSMSPTLEGGISPMQYEASECLINEDRINRNSKGFSFCQAGQSSFHINSAGKASICKVARKPSVDVKIVGQQVLDLLPQISNQLFSDFSECNKCDERGTCSTCPLLYKFYQKSGQIPPSVCYKYKRKGGDKDGTGNARSNTN